MTTKYLEVDSTYRNRKNWPLQSYFLLENTRSIQTDDDPLSDAMPIISWKGRNSIIAQVVSSTLNTIIITDINLPHDSNYYTNATFSPPGTRISSYTYLGSNQAEIIISINLTNALATGTTVSITDSTDLLIKRIFVPQLFGSIPSNYYIGKILYDESTGGYSNIIFSDKNTGTVTVSDVITGWNLTDSFNIRTSLPIQTGLADPSSTTNNVVGVLSTQPGSFIRLLPVYPHIQPAGQVSRIINYNIATSSITIFPPFTASPALFVFEILPYTDTNVKQLTYSGTTQVECVNSTVRLLNLMIPHKLFSVGYGGYPTNYPYLYVKLTPKNSININVNCSNNPNGYNALFRATNTHISSVSNDISFIKFSGDDIAVKVRFKVDTDIVFQVTLPSGESIEYVIADNISPMRPNPMLQISAVFEVVRNH